MCGKDTGRQQNEPPKGPRFRLRFLLFSQKGATKLKELDPKRPFEAVAAEIEAQYVQVRSFI